MTTDDRKEFQNRIEAQLREAGQKLNVLWMLSRDATGDARILLHGQIGPLRDKQSAARATLDELKRGGDAVWQESKSGAEKVWNELKLSTEKIVVPGGTL